MVLRQSGALTQHVISKVISWCWILVSSSLCASPSCEEEEEEDGTVQPGAQEEGQGPQTAG